MESKSNANTPQRAASGYCRACGKKTSQCTCSVIEKEKK